VAVIGEQGVGQWAPQATVPRLIPGGATDLPCFRRLRSSIGGAEVNTCSQLKQRAERSPGARQPVGSCLPRPGADRIRSRDRIAELRSRCSADAWRRPERPSATRPTLDQYQRSTFRCQETHNQAPANLRERPPRLPFTRVQEALLRAPHSLRAGKAAGLRRVPSNPHKIQG